MSNATTHIGTNVNPANCEQVMFPLQVGLIGRSKAKVMTAGGGGGDNVPRMPTWNHQANMSIGMGGPLPMMMTPDRMQPMIQPSMMMQ